MEVPRKDTPISTHDAAKMIMRLAPGMFPGLTADGARLLLAHLWFETGSGKILRNYNPGNLSAGGFRGGGKEVISWKGDYYRPSWFTNKKSKYYAQMKAGKAPSAFRAYANLKEGVTQYLSLIHRRTALRKAVFSANPGEFADAVRTTRYTADAPKSLGNSLAKMVKSYANKGLFNSLPKKTGMGTAAAGNIGAALAVVGVVGFIFWRTVKGVKKK